jgi:hypothetical protein
MTQHKAANRPSLPATPLHHAAVHSVSKRAGIFTFSTTPNQPPNSVGTSSCFPWVKQSEREANIAHVQLQWDIRAPRELPGLSRGRTSWCWLRCRLFRLFLARPWRWRRYVPAKLQASGLHGVTNQNTVTFQLSIGRFIIRRLSSQLTPFTLR